MIFAKSSVERGLAAYDIHVGRERANVGCRDELTSRSLHDAAALAAMFEFAHDWKPDIFVLGGDQLDAGCVSHWNSSTPGKVEGARLRDDLDELDRLVITPADKVTKKRKIWIRGNHERFVSDVLDRQPALRGLVGVESHLRLRERGWELYDFGEAARTGKIYWLHGEHVGSNQYGAKRAVEMYGRNVRFGHHHSYATHVKTSPIDESDFHSAVMVPCLCRKNPGYAKNRPNNWVNGFATFEIAPSGMFNTHVHLMVKGKFVANGKVYGNGGGR